MGEGKTWATEDGRPYIGHGTPCPYDNARDRGELKKGASRSAPTDSRNNEGGHETRPYETLSHHWKRKNAIPYPFLTLTAGKIAEKVLPLPMRLSMLSSP